MDSHSVSFLLASDELLGLKNKHPHTVKKKGHTSSEIFLPDTTVSSILDTMELSMSGR